MGNHMEKKKPPTVWGSMAVMGQLGFTIAVPPIVGALLGGYLDGLIHTEHLFLLLGLLLGLAAGIFGAYRSFSTII